jgi:hypothetical protein
MPKMSDDGLDAFDHATWEWRDGPPPAVLTGLEWSNLITALQGAAADELGFDPAQRGILGKAIKKLRDAELQLHGATIAAEVSVPFTQGERDIASTVVEMTIETAAARTRAQLVRALAKLMERP